MAIVPLYVRLNDTEFVINNEQAAQVIIDLTMSFARIPAIVDAEDRIKTVKERQEMSGAVEVKPDLGPPIDNRGDHSCRCVILPVRRGTKSP